MLKPELETLDEIPETLHEYYKKHDESGKYVLQVEGLVAKAKLDEFRNNNINLAKERDKLQTDLESIRESYHNLEPEEVAKMQETLESIKDKKILDDEGIDALVESRLNKLRTEHESALKARDKRINELTDQADTWSSKYRRTILDRALSDAALKAGVRPQAVTDVVLRGQGMWTLNEDGKPVAKQGNDVVYGKDGTNPMSPTEWMESLREDAPHFFEPSSGGGASGGNGSGGPTKSKVRFKSDLKGPAEKSAFISEHGFDAFQKLPLGPDA